MSSEMYSDGIGEIMITGSVVRIDFVSLSPIEKGPDGQPKAIFRQRIVMPLEGFMHSMGILEKATQKLIEDGRLKRTDAAPHPQASSNFP
jgi:hypothetical protein